VIVSNDEIRQKVVALWKAGGLPRGSSTGWPSVDQHYTVGLGQWTLITGTPNSGKSEWLDALMVNLVKQEDWKFYIFSPENWPLELHHAKILEKYLGKPFDPGPTPRMDEEEVQRGEDWIADKFYFCKPDKCDMFSIASEASDAFLATKARHTGCKLGVVMDPWNQLEHFRPSNMSETEYVSHELSNIIKVVRLMNMHLWLVAHPAKMQKNRDGSYPVPRPHDVSGSAHFWNKADNCITVWRDQAEGSQDVDIHVQKVRFKHIGRIGLATLKYDRVTGRYFEPLRTVSNVRDYKSAASGDAPI
jgi:twinkle protein